MLNEVVKGALLAMKRGGAHRFRNDGWYRKMVDRIRFRSKYHWMRTGVGPEEEKLGVLKQSLKDVPGAPKVGPVTVVTRVRGRGEKHIEVSDCG